MTTRNARFQQWEALLTNRTKRQRLGEFLVQGVRPINCARDNGWRFRSLLFNSERTLSAWAVELLEGTEAEQIAVAPQLLAELGEKADTAPELIAVVALPPDDLGRITVTPDFLGVVFDRPTNPGNIGTLLRSADALGAHAVITTGHSADAYDPRSIRASTGSVFGLPVVRADSPAQVLNWLAGTSVTIVGTDEAGRTDIAEQDFTTATLLVVGNETTGLSQSWREGCDVTVRIPITGTASSLNAATAGSIVLYEAARQRRAN